MPAKTRPTVSTVLEVEERQFTREELARLFDTSDPALWRLDETSLKTHFGRARIAKAVTPLIMVLSDMRPDEVAWLRHEDIVERDGVRCFHVHEIEHQDARHVTVDPPAAEPERRACCSGDRRVPVMGTVRPRRPLAARQGERARALREGLRKCPYCAELVKQAAKVAATASATFPAWCSV